MFSLLPTYCLLHLFSAPDLLLEVNLIRTVVSIPILEPLSSSRLNKIMLLTLGCVGIATYAACGYFTTCALGKTSFLLFISI